MKNFKMRFLLALLQIDLYRQLEADGTGAKFDFLQKVNIMTTAIFDNPFYYSYLYIFNYN